MAGKRSRISQSPSFGNTGVVLDRRPIQDEDHQKQRWESQLTAIDTTAATSPDHSPQGIFALCSILPPLPLSSPPARKTERADSTAHFLDRCFYCKKRLDHRQDIYMYGAFSAFCTSECRDMQYEIDKKGGNDKVDNECIEGCKIK